MLPDKTESPFTLCGYHMVKYCIIHY